LVACTYLGGNLNEGNCLPGSALGLTAEGNLVVVTSTTSSNYPTIGTPYCDSLTGFWDFGISVLTNDLTTLLASTYLGGSGEESAPKVVCFPDGRIVVAGITKSSDFPTTSGVVDPTYGGGTVWGYDVFVCVFDGSLSNLMASTFLGQAGEDFVEGFLAAPGGGYVISGWTSSTYNFPMSGSAAFPTYRGGSYDGFITHLSDDLTTLVAGTYLGGSAWDFVYGMAVDTDGSVVVTGHTATRTGFPITSGSYDETYNSVHGADVGDDAFIVRLDAQLSTVLVGSYLGGSGWENGRGVAIDDEGLVFVMGGTNSTDFPYTPGTFDSTVTPSYKYWSDSWVCCFDPDIQTMIFGSIIGGSDNDGLGSMTFDSDHNLYLCGNSRSLDFPTTPDAYDTSHNGGYFDWGGDLTISAFAKGYWHDSDDDGRPDFFDNCPDVFNPIQDDADSDGVGDACEPCCGNYTGGYTGNTNCDTEGKRNLGDITKLIDRVYVSKAELCCEANGNIDGDEEDKINLADITKLIDHVYVSKTETAPCE
jgi:hypothetical protein